MRSELLRGNEGALRDMAHAARIHTANERLTSWKEIAAYFGHDQRTVKRWEQTRGLPVRRLPGVRSGVFALVSEVQAWQRGEPVAISTSEPEVDYLTEAISEPLPLIAQPEESKIYLAPVAEAAAESVAQRESEQQRNRIWSAVAFMLLAVVATCSAYAVYRGALTRPARAEVKSAHVPALRARELYLAGRFRWNKRTPADIQAAQADFEEAIRIDPDYAAAYAGIADCYALTPEFANNGGGPVYPKLLQMARKALELDPELPEGHRALAFGEFYWNWDQKGSRAEFEKAIELAPADATTHHWFANTLSQTGKVEEALKEIDRARDLDPTSLATLIDRSMILYQAGHRTEARDNWIQLEKTDPDFLTAHIWLAKTYWDDHQPQPYLLELRHIAKIKGTQVDSDRLSVATKGLEAGGEKGLRANMAGYEATLYKRGQTNAFNVAMGMMYAGNQEDALTFLERSYVDRDDSFPAIGATPLFAALHDQPRFQRLVALSTVPRV